MRKFCPLETGAEIFRFSHNGFCEYGVIKTGSITCRLGHIRPGKISAIQTGAGEFRFHHACVCEIATLQITLAKICVIEITPAKILAVEHLVGFLAAGPVHSWLSLVKAVGLSSARYCQRDD
jgi:hypothetical protein